MKESGGVKNDCSLERNANPIMYAATKAINNHEEVKYRVCRMNADSTYIGMLLARIRYVLSSIGVGSSQRRQWHSVVEWVNFIPGICALGLGPSAYLQTVLKCR